MTDQLDKKKQDALRPLTDEKAREEAHLTEAELKAAIERGRQALEALEKSAKPSTVISPKIRFA